MSCCSFAAIAVLSFLLFSALSQMSIEWGKPAEWLAEEAGRLEKRRKWQEWPRHKEPRRDARFHRSDHAKGGKGKDKGSAEREPTAPPAVTPSSVADDMKTMRLDYTLATSFMPQRHLMMVLGRPVVA